MATESLGGIEISVDVDTAGAVASTKAIDTQTKKIEGSFKKLDTQVSKTAKGVNSGLSSMGRKAGQAGIQLQQFVGQVQGGQSAMLALSQQGADLGFVLGAPLVGAIVGIAASIAGFLLPSLINSTSNMDLFEKSVERVKATLTLSAEGVANYTDQMKRLSLVSKELAQAQLRSAIAEQEKAFKLGSAALREYTQDVTSFTRGFSSFADRVEDLTGKKAGADGFNEARAALIAFRTEVTAFSLKPTEDSVEDLSNALLRLEQAGAQTTEKGRELIAETLKQIQAYKEGQIAIDELNKALADNAEITESSKQATIDKKDKVEELVEAIKLEASTLGLTDRALALHTAYVNGATQADYEAINASFDKIEAYEREQKAIADKLAAEKKAEAERLSRERSATGFAQGIVSSGLTESEKLAADLEKLQELRAQELINVELYESAKTTITQKQEELRRNAILQSNSAILMSTSAFFGESAELVKSAAGEQSSAYKTLFAVSKAFAIANAALNLGTALSNASALPYPANIPAFIQAGVQGAQLASQIASVNYGGGREYGGPVSANSLYEVGEKNKPEIFQSGGRQYMIPGNDGKVIPNSDIGGGQSIQVIVNNLPGQDAKVSESTTSDGRMRQIAIEVVNQQSSAVGSTLNQNINRNHNTTNRLGGNRRN